MSGEAVRVGGGGYEGWMKRIQLIQGAVENASTCTEEMGVASLTD